VITSAISTAIGATRERVWRALTTPSELIRWNDQIVSLVEPAPGYPQIGQRTRWRYRMGSVEVTAIQTIRRLDHQERLQSEMSMGLFHFDETYLLQTDPVDAGRTRVSLRVTASNSIPIVGGTIDRFEVRRLTADLIDSRLRSVQKWCENCAERDPVWNPGAAIAPSAKARTQDQCRVPVVR
jgi:uncharacterized protein YndB with AHSA1/START domain